jgi:methylglutaconyl-CoA hydratase
VVLQSWGDRAFCAGASFDELVAINDFSTGVEFFMGFARVINAARKCPKLLIGRVQGKAVGGGVGMAASVDYCFATQHAQVKLSELAVGIGPFVVGPAVARKVGLSAMSELAIQATEWRSAEWAHQKAQRLKASNPQAMAELKQIFWEGTDHWDQLLASRAEKSGKLVLSDFTRNAITQFKSKS